MAVRLWVVTLALAAFLVETEVAVSAEELVFSRMAFCEHMTEPPKCPKTFNPVCGTNGVTYASECLLCLARIETKQDIQIIKDGKC